MKRFTTLLVSAALAGVTALTSTAQAESLRFAVGFPSASANVDAAKAYAKAVADYSGGDLEIKIYELSLLNLAEMSGGLKQGIADVGYLLTPYFPAEYPNINMAAELSMLLALNDPTGNEGLAYAGAMSEYIMLHCDDCVAELKQQNQVFTGGGASPQYGLLCTTPVTTAADLKGKRLRAGGAQWARWAKHFEASPVSLPGNEIFEALNQGVVDCTIQSAAELSGLGLMDAVSDITMSVPGGVFGGSGPANINQKVWQDLDADQRKALLHAGTVMSANAAVLYRDYGERDLKAAEQRGAKRHEASEALIAASRDFVRQDAKNIVQYYEEKHQVRDAAGKIEVMRPLVKKWLELTADIDSTEALADLYWQEVQSKVDVDRYGL